MFLESGAVTDTEGNNVPASQLGGFEVSVPTIDSDVVRLDDLDFTDLTALC